ncbi:hypothetical protein [Leucobacter ruminantium]|uniref:Uncharacterized protein n=1 Tax=Leucobacter ruminantium TaxID=1289170 RepID=A0A939RXA5_9MICO|nr:hypothetical protein [Leucobacter ruminantium]MBO1804488.1 hypothetical protein [Leucobacter ruminantium]
MSMYTVIHVDHIPATDHEAERIRAAFTRLAERFDFPGDLDIDVWRDAKGRFGAIRLGAYAHAFQIDDLDSVARVISRLIPEHDVHTTEEGLHDEYWGERATYRAGRKTSQGVKEWVDLPTSD